VGTELALYPLGSSVDAMRKVANAIGRATVDEVLAHQSVVKVSVTDTNHDLKQETTYNGVLVNLPLPKLGVCLEGDQAALDAVREALKTSLYVEEVTSAAKYRLLATGEQYAITKPADPRPLVQQLKGFSPDNGRRALQHLEAMARWETAGQLASSPGCRISADEVKMEFYTADKKEKIEESLIRLTYTHDAGKSKPPGFRMKLSNHSDKKLFCTVLVLGADYSIKAPLFQHQGVWIEAGQEFWAFGDKVIPATIKDDYWKQGITEYQDILMLIACTQEFDASLMEQVGLNPPTRNRDISPGKGRLSHLLHKVAQRDIGDVESEEFDEWLTSSITVITTRPQDETPISNREEVDLGLHLKVKPHSALQATVRLSTISQSTRDVGGSILPSELLEDTSPFQFTNGRGVDPGLSCIELKLTAGDTHDKCENKSWQSVTTENPLKLSVEQKLEEGEYVLPISFDGEFYIPLGLGKTKDNTTEITIERLTDPISQGQRSLGGSIRIFFRKVFAKKLGLDFPYPILSAVSYKNKDKPEYIAKVEDVAANVKSANRIILFLHGIIGDTQSIVPCAQEEIKEFGDAKSLNNIYDLVLAFDYENLNTPIQELGQQLGQRLAAVGLGPNHGKTLHIVAHSMGGLVSRSFIEQAGGHKVVQHLIMVGTPNGGSPWSTVQDWAFTALTLGINGLAVSGMPIAALGNLLAGVEAIDVNLDQMKPNSKFLAALRQSEDPRVPYTIVAGNTSIIKPVNNESSGKLLRLFEQLRKLRKSAVEFPFLGEPNDIACLVSSIKDLPPDRKIPAQIIEVACNHLVYFSDAEGLKALGKALLGTGVHADLDPENGPQQPAINPNKAPEVQKIELNLLEHKPAKAAISEVQSETQTNRIAVSPHGSSQSQTIKGFNHSYAVIIGIDQYSGGIPKLSNAVNDAKRISEILEQDHGYDVTTLIDEHATQLSIIELLTNDLGAKVKPDDRLLLYFAGHGLAQDDRDGKGPQGYFIPYDAIMHDPKTYVSMKNLRDALRDINCRHFLGLLDCCYAGSFRWSSYRDIGDSLKSEMFLESYHHYISEAAWQVIASSSYDEKAHDSSPLDQKDLFESSSRERSRGGEHSPFASALINGLSGKADRLPDGVITADELNMYIYDEVVKITESAGKRQTPQIWSFNESHKGKYIFLTPGLGGLKLRKAPVLKEGTNPYKGLEAYEREDANSFFGRKEEVEKLFEFVKGNPLTVLMGASGSGKSSLVKAGLIPRVESIATASKQQAVLKAQPGNETEKAWSVMTMHPGEKPFENLATALSRSINGEQCISSKDGFLDSLSNWFQKIPDCRLLIIIDQSEELITQCTEQVRKEFLAALTSGLVKYKSCLHILFTLRSDMEPQLRSHMAPLLLEMDPNRGWSTVRHFIGAMTRSQLREAIEKPAEEITMFFKPHTLVEDLVNEVADMPGALPLLSFAMSQLYTKYLERQRDAQIKNDNIERAMTKEDYEAIGGVIASLNKKANQVHEDLVKKSPGNDHMIRHMMLRMVAIEGGENARRPVPMSELDFPEEKDCQINEIIESFVSARLLVRKGASGKTTEQANSLESADRSSNKQVNDTALKDEGFLEPAHDALVTGWTKLQEWLQEYRHNIPLQRQLTPRAFEWHEKAGNDPQLSFVQKSIKVLDKRFLTIETNLARLIPKRKNPLLAASTSLLWTNDPYLEVINTQNQTNKWLNKVEAEFVSKSNLQKRKNSSWRNRTIASVLFAMASLTAVAWWQKLDSDRRRVNAEVVSHTLQADEQWKNHNELVALVDSMKAVKLVKQNNSIAYGDKIKAILTLDQIVSRIRQKQILEGDSISFSQDGNVIATGDGTRFKLWNAKGIKTTESWPNDSSIFSVFLGPNGKTIAYQRNDGLQELKLTNVETNRSISIKASADSGDICDVVFNPNSNLIRITDDMANFIESSIQGTDIAMQRVGSSIGASGCSYLSPDGKVIASKASDNTIRVTTILGRAFTDIRDDDMYNEMDRHVGDLMIRTHVLSPDGRSIAYRLKSGSIRIKDLLGNKVISLNHYAGNDSVSQYNQFTFSPDGKTLASAAANGIMLFGLEDQGRRFIADNDPLKLAFSPDSNTLASMSLDGSVKLWDWRRETTRFIDHGIKIHEVMFSPDSQTLTTITEDSIFYWTEKGRFRSRYIHNNEEFKSAKFSPNDNTLAFITEDINGNKRKVKLLNLDAKDNSFRTLDMSPANLATEELFFSPDGKILAIETDNAFELHSLEGNNKVTKISKSTSSFYGGFGFIRADGQTFFLLKRGPEVKLCNLSGDCKLSITLKGQNEAPETRDSSLDPISFSPNGKILATNEKNNVKLWNFKGDPIQTLKGHTKKIFSIAFMPDGEAIVTTSRDNTVKIWSIDGKVSMDLNTGDNNNRVYSVSISPDGKTIAAKIDKKIKIWNLDADDLLAQGCNLAEDYLTTSDNQQLCAGVLPIKYTDQNPPPGFFAQGGLTCQARDPDLQNGNPRRREEVATCTLGPKAFNGTFVDNQFLGYDAQDKNQGLRIFRDGSYCVAPLSKGELHGQGECWLVGKQHYKGSFANGKFNGTGILTNNDGSKFEGLFKNDKPVQALGIYKEKDAASNRLIVIKGLPCKSGTDKDCPGEKSN
jgi:WD40 repeat protein/pimeloyl-ACP methyl ester carboxylesterase